MHDRQSLIISDIQVTRTENIAFSKTDTWNYNLKEFKYWNCTDTEMMFIILNLNRAHENKSESSRLLSCLSFCAILTNFNMLFLMVLSSFNENVYILQN